MGKLYPKSHPLVYDQNYIDLWLFESILTGNPLFSSLTDQREVRK